MAEGVDNDIEATEVPSGPRAGERLADARREKDISLEDVAKELHLDEQKVRALERNEFDALGAPVFAKGHLRKYAQLVDIEYDTVLAEYYEMNRGGPEPLIVSAKRRPDTELSPGPWLAAAALLVLLAVVYWWLGVRVSGPAVVDAPAEQAAEAEVASAELLPPLIERVEEEPLADAEPEPAITQEQPQVQPPPAEAAVVEAPEAPDDGLLDLVVTFSGDCWTEISDASGKRLFFGLGKAGRRVELSGEAPINVLFGNAGNASIDVEGSPRAIRASERRGRTARLTLTEL